MWISTIMGIFRIPRETGSAFSIALVNDHIGIHRRKMRESAR